MVDDTGISLADVLFQQGNIEMTNSSKNNLYLMFVYVCFVLCLCRNRCHGPLRKGLYIYMRRFQLCVCL